MAELHAKPANVNVDGAAASVVVNPPNPLEELSPGEHSAAVLAKKAQKRELLMGQLAIPAVDRDLVGGQIDAERPHLDPLLLCEVAAAPLDATDPL